MILVDANLLIYAHVRSFPQHNQSRIWLDEQLSGKTPVGLPWTSLLAFLRIVTNPRIFVRPEATPSAWKQVVEWLDSDVVWVPQPTERHREILGSFLGEPGIQAGLVQDAYLAALAMEHGLALCSTDGDFARFRGLRWLNPLAA
jgi:toxin-antitoxin system PIN domain toxin